MIKIILSPFVGMRRLERPTPGSSFRNVVRYQLRYIPLLNDDVAEN